MDNIDFCRWESSCGRKVRFSRVTHAKMRIRRIMHSGNGLAVDALAAYRCKFCGGFHIGHAKCDERVIAKNAWREEL
jgi:ribosomal protein L32